MAVAVEAPTIFAAPGQDGSVVELKGRYENFIGGEWVPPTGGKYRENLTPATAEAFCEVADSSPDGCRARPRRRPRREGRVGPSVARRTRGSAGCDRRRDAGEPRDAGGRGELGERQAGARDARARICRWRSTTSATSPGAVRAEEGSISEIDEQTYAYHFREPLGVVGQIIPFNFPLLMAAWKLAPALAGGNCTVIKPASPTPWSLLKLAEVIEDVVPAGVINIVNGSGAEVGRALGSSKRIAKIAFTGETVTGRLIMGYAAQNLIPSTTELGGKSPNIFFEDILDADDALLDKAIEGLVLYAFNKGEVCTCPSRALIQESIYEEFMAALLWSASARSARATRWTPPRRSARRSLRPSSRRSKATCRSASTRAPSS